VTAALDAIVSELIAGRAEKRPLELLSLRHALDEATAYAVQERLVAALTAGSGDIAGYKIAMTSESTMALAGASEPAYGVLLTSMLRASPADVALDELYQPRIEAELIFLFDGAVSADPSPDEIVAATRVAPALEVPSARFRDWFGRMPVVDLVSDNTAAALVVVGAQAVPARGLALDSIAMRLEHDGRPLAEGGSAEVLGTPLNAVAWLARKLAAHGKRIEPGMLVSSGTFTMPSAVESGRYEAVFEGLGTVKVSFR
jgi:2-oxo-hept-3-ene-1,7-dioate hydratase